jgi:N-acetyl-gamma-glutamyl-phosphate/LysW-gamma-L-alpha-aminoadipyl-6-phosphate reductase
VRVSVVGASGYVGGELLRLLLGHPHVEVQQATSETNAGKFVHQIHPNLRKVIGLKFVSAEDLKPVDFLFLALPHGMTMYRIEEFLSISERLIDLSADFRLRDPKMYPMYYGHEHPRPEMLTQFVYGIPEVRREELRTARWATGAGCLATATILGLMPLFKQGIVRSDPVVVEAKVGSSAAGNKPSLATHHPERSEAIRSFQPTMHRHTAEIEQELTFGTRPRVHFSATAVGLVRGVLVTAHLFLKEDVQEKEIWGIYREAYGAEPFIRIVKEKGGVYRYLTGSNFCDIGFERDPASDRLVVMAALDNLMKGAAGNAVQAMNVMMGYEERAGLEFVGLHPI